MPWLVTVHADLQIVETNYSDNLSPDELKAAVDKTIEEARLHLQDK
jgi:hypothetical protein